MHLFQNKHKLLVWKSRDNSNDSNMVQRIIKLLHELLLNVKLWFLTYLHLMFPWLAFVNSRLHILPSFWVLNQSFRNFISKVLFIDGRLMGLIRRYLLGWLLLCLIQSVIHWRSISRFSRKFLWKLTNFWFWGNSLNLFKRLLLLQLHSFLVFLMFKFGLVLKELLIISHFLLFRIIWLKSTIFQFLLVQKTLLL